MHTCTPSYSEVVVEDWGPRSAGQKHETLSEKQTSQTLVTHAYNPNYLGGWDWEDHSSRPVWANSSRESISKNNQSKMAWRQDSGGKMPVLQALSSNPKPSPTPKKKKI
jgi:hypothetical protein